VALAGALRQLDAVKLENERLVAEAREEKERAAAAVAGSRDARMTQVGLG
jgi:hypothetical protein